MSGARAVSSGDASRADLDVHTAAPGSGTGKPHKESETTLENDVQIPENKGFELAGRHGETSDVMRPLTPWETAARQLLDAQKELLARDEDGQPVIETPSAEIPLAAAIELEAMAEADRNREAGGITIGDLQGLDEVQIVAMPAEEDELDALFASSQQEPDVSPVPERRESTLETAIEAPEATSSLLGDSKLESGAIGLVAITDDSGAMSSETGTPADAPRSVLFQASDALFRDPSVEELSLEKPLSLPPLKASYVADGEVSGELERAVAGRLLSLELDPPSAERDLRTDERGFRLTSVDTDAGAGDAAFSDVVDAEVFDANHPEVVHFSQQKAGAPGSSEFRAPSAIIAAEALASALEAVLREGRAGASSDSASNAIEAALRLTPSDGPSATHPAGFLQLASVEPSGTESDTSLEPISAPDELPGADADAPRHVSGDVSGDVSANDSANDSADDSGDLQAEEGIVVGEPQHLQASDSDDGGQPEVIPADAPDELDLQGAVPMSDASDDNFDPDLLPMPEGDDAVFSEASIDKLVDALTLPMPDETEFDEGEERYEVVFQNEAARREDERLEAARALEARRVQAELAQVMNALEAAEAQVEPFRVKGGTSPSVANSSRISGTWQISGRTVTPGTTPMASPSGMVRTPPVEASPEDTLRLLDEAESALLTPKPPQPPVQSQEVPILRLVPPLAVADDEWETPREPEPGERQTSENSDEASPAPRPLEEKSADGAAPVTDGDFEKS